MNILSLFDGISCGQVAAYKAGIQIKNYIASEIKPTAIKCAEINYPNTKHVGDVRNVHVTNLGVESDMNLCTYIYGGVPDLLIGGSPCKGISKLNQKQQGLQHSESILFYEYLRIWEQLKVVNPNAYFLLENTPGKKEAINEITEKLGVRPIRLNSSLVSAQNRVRLYWTNIPNVTAPKDKGITTQFILDGKYVDAECQKVSDGRVKWLNNDSGKKSVSRGYTKINPFPKAGCITANGHRKWNENYILTDGKYRFLSRIELEKLQTLPMGYTNMLTYEEAYDVIGDGWTVDMIAHILSHIPKDNQLTPSPKQ